MRILVTNDDGIFADGIKALAAALSDLGEILVVAPDREQSAMSHALTLNRPLRARRVEEHWYAVDGTPSDCVNLAVQGIYKEQPPDLVVAGINFGPNLGDDVTYSGTVSAAFEGNLHGLPSLAFSQRVKGEYDFERSARRAREIVASLLEGGGLEGGLPRNLLLNVNLPSGTCRGIRLARLSRRYYHQTIVEKTDPKGRPYFWIAGKPEWEEADDTDYAVLTAGYISVTPLHLDLTDYPGLDSYNPLLDRLAHLEEAVRGEASGDGDASSADEEPPRGDGALSHPIQDS